MNSFSLTVSTPEGTVFSDKALCFTCRGTEGELAVMAGHVPFATAVEEGTVSITMESGEKKKAHSAGGLLSVGENGAAYLTSSITFEEA